MKLESISRFLNTIKLRHQSFDFRMSHSFRSIFKNFGSKSKSNEVEEVVIEEQEENDLGDKDKEKNGKEAETVKGIKQVDTSSIRGNLNKF